MESHLSLFTNCWKVCWSVHNHRLNNNLPVQSLCIFQIPPGHADKGRNKIRFSTCAASQVEFRCEDRAQRGLKSERFSVWDRRRRWWWTWRMKKHLWAPAEINFLTELIDQQVCEVRENLRRKQRKCYAKKLKFCFKWSSCSQRQDYSYSDQHQNVKH